MTTEKRPAILIFDYDGTLHDCAKIYIPAFRKTYERLVSEGLAEKRQFTDRQISSWLGYSPKEMWETFLPSLSPEQATNSSQQIGQEMLTAIEKGQARLYEGCEEVLKCLRDEGYLLLFLSNCKRAYMDLHRHYFHLDRFFSGYYCGEDYGYKPKYEIFRQIESDFPGSPGSYAIIGDRFHDMEIAEKHRLKAIGCVYGYGNPEELTYASAAIQDIRQLPNVLSQL